MSNTVNNPRQIFQILRSCLVQTFQPSFVAQIRIAAGDFAWTTDTQACISTDFILSNTLLGFWENL